MPKVADNVVWTFLSNHSHILICIYNEPEIRLRDLAVRVGITERAVHRIVTELVQEGYLSVEKSGRRNFYHVNADIPLRHEVESHRKVSDLLNLFHI